MSASSKSVLHFIVLPMSPRRRQALLCSDQGLKLKPSAFYLFTVVIPSSSACFIPTFHLLPLYCHSTRFFWNYNLGQKGLRIFKNRGYSYPLSPQYLTLAATPSPSTINVDKFRFHKLCHVYQHWSGGGGPFLNKNKSKVNCHSCDCSKSKTRIFSTILSKSVNLLFINSLHFISLKSIEPPALHNKK